MFLNNKYNKQNACFYFKGSKISLEHAGFFENQVGHLHGHWHWPWVVGFGFVGAWVGNMCSKTSSCLGTLP